MLRDILSIPSCFGKERLVIGFIADFAAENGIDCRIDEGNVYLTKGKPGEGMHYPCVVAHTDTVHTDQMDMVESGERLLLKEEEFDGRTKLTAFFPGTDIRTGIGGDDKCGVYIALRLMTEFDVIKGAFFVEEEIGMQGSKRADDTFFGDVGYAIQFDAPTRNWFSSRLMGLPIWNEAFFKKVGPVLEQYGIDNITSGDPFTDVLQMRRKYGICCAVFPTGYYNQHSRMEYVLEEETEECVALGVSAIEALGGFRYDFASKMQTAPDNPKSA